MTTILIIDDDVTLLTRLGTQLEEAGFTVQRSSDLAHAQRLYSEQRPDLVILEVRAGGDQGWDLLARYAPLTPTLVLSGAGREEDVVRGFTSGAIDYVAKPYRTDEFLARVRARLAAAAPVELGPPERPQAAAMPRAAAPPPPPPRRRNSRRDDQPDEAVFMSEAEEMALLRMPMPPSEAPARAEPAPDAAEPIGLGPRLRAERQRRHLTLVQLENELKIRMSYLQALEDEKYTLLPRGPVVLQIVRGYADFLGLDAATITEEFRRQHYIEPAPPPPALGGARLARPMPIWVIWLIAAALAIAIAVGLIYALDPGFFTRLPELLRGLWEQRPG